MQTINLAKYNTTRNIKNFWKDVLDTGVVIDTFKDAFVELKFYYFHGKTYVVDPNDTGNISKESPDTWKSMKLNMQDDD